MGIAAIGTYTDLTGGDSATSTIPGAAPTQAMTTSMARIAAWKLGMSGISPTATSTLTEGTKDSYGFTYGKSYTLNAVSGHRNGFATDCPGNQLYAELPDIRAYAAGPATGVAVTAVSGPYGTTKSGTAYVTGTKATVRWTATTPSAPWKATDDNGLHAQAASAPTAASLAASAASWSTTTKAATSTQFALKATDLAGNTATASVTRTATLVQESAAKATGTWTKRSGTSYLGGYSTSSSTTGATLTWTFKGRSVAWIASRATTSGQVKIYLDGTYQTTVDLKSATTQYRQAMWTKNWSSTAQHTLKIVVVGTFGRPTVTTDGIAVLG